MTRNGPRDSLFRRGADERRERLHPAITVHSAVIHQAIAEVRQNPTIEVGGKFVGYVEGEFSSYDDDWRAAFNQLRITILGNLDPGPGRDRSAVHHYSDTDYQLQLFQRVAPEFPELRFLGLWHSHHPNGLRELSGGDRQTGLQTVNSDGHELDLLLSSLVIDSAGLLGGRHFVFLRGHERFYEIGGRSVEVTNGSNRVAAAVERNARWLYSQAGQRPIPRTAGTSRSARRGERHEAGTHGSPASWLQSPDGREALAFDSAWLRSYPSLRPATRDGGVVWRGPVDAGSVTVSCAYYLPGQPDATPVAEFSGAEGAVSLRVSLEEAATRAARFATCLATLAGLAGAPDAKSAGAPDRELASPPDPRLAGAGSTGPAGASHTTAGRDGTEAVPDGPAPAPERTDPGQPDETSHEGHQENPRNGISEPGTRFGDPTTTDLPPGCRDGSEREIT